MKKNAARRGRIWFSQATFRRLPMAEKLAYLRTAFNALGKGLRVRERRRFARDNSRYSRMRPASVPLPSVALLSQAEFDRLAMTEKLSYLSRAIREVRRMRGPVSTS